MVDRSYLKLAYAFKRTSKTNFNFILPNIGQSRSCTTRSNLKALTSVPQETLPSAVVFNTALRLVRFSGLFRMYATM